MAKLCSMIRVISYTILVCVSCGGWERGLAVETEKIQSRKNAEKRAAYPPSAARCVRWLFPELFDNGGKPHHCQSGVPPKARAPIERCLGRLVCRLPR